MFYMRSLRLPPAGMRGVRWQSAVKPPTHFGFATGKRPPPDVLGQTQRKPPPKDPKDPRFHATGRPMFDPRKPSEFSTKPSAMETYRTAADKYFNEMAQAEPWMHYVRENIQGLMLWQLVLEQGLTLLVALLIGVGLITTQSVNDLVRRVTGWDIGLDTHCVWEKDVFVLGSDHINDEGRTIKIKKEWLTRYSQAHQIVFATILLQIPLTYHTYGLVLSVWNRLPVARYVERMEKAKVVRDARKASISPPGNLGTTI